MSKIAKIIIAVTSKLQNYQTWATWNILRTTNQQILMQKDMVQQV